MKGIAPAALLLLFAWSIASAAPGKMYVAADAPLKSPSGAMIGTVMPGTKVDVASRGGGVTTVTIDGWQPANDASVILEGVDSRVVLVNLASPHASSLNAIGTKTDAYGSSWNEVRISGILSNARLVGSVDAVWKSAAAVYGQRCSACHTLHQPSEFTANQWPGIVASMARNASLTSSQTDLVVRYLQAHARG